ncbi:unnamed protein product [Coccothraustes coccothraustes]
MRGAEWSAPGQPEQPLPLGLFLRKREWGKGTVGDRPLLDTLPTGAQSTSPKAESRNTEQSERRGGFNLSRNRCGTGRERPVGGQALTIETLHCSELGIRARDSSGGPHPGSLFHYVVESGEFTLRRCYGRSRIEMAVLGGADRPGVRPVRNRGLGWTGRGERAQLLPSELHRAGGRWGRPAWPCLRLPARQRQELRAATAGLAPPRPPPVSATAAAPRLLAVTQPLASAIRSAALPQNLS